ncbi:hypothetical protein BU25DRAFT_304057, partial [Macroventuria anomochaeta]
HQEVANQTGLLCSMLLRNDQGVTAPRAEADLQQHKLTLQQERELCEYIEVLTEHHLPPTRQMVQNFAAEMAHESVSDTWVSNFLYCHSDTLLHKWCTAMDKQRHYTNSPAKYEQYFKLLH